MQLHPLPQVSNTRNIATTTACLCTVLAWTPSCCVDALLTALSCVHARCDWSMQVLCMTMASLPRM